MALVERVTNILLKPKFEWPKIAEESATTASLYTGYIMLLAALGPLVMAIKTGLGVAVLSYGISLGVTFLLAMIVDALAPTFGGEKNFVQSLKLTAYSYTAAWIAAVLQIIPFLGGVLSLLGAIYAWYTFYLGVAIMKKCPEEKAVVYTVAIVVCGLLLGIVLFGALMSMFFGGAMLGGAGLMHWQRRADVFRPDERAGLEGSRPSVRGRGAGLGVRRRHHRVRDAVEALPPRLRAAVQVALELRQRAAIHLALEIDHGVERHPVVVPTPGVEFRTLIAPQLEVGVAPDEAQQIPDLLLPAVAAPPFPFHPALRHLVTQPVARTTQNPDVVGMESDLLVQLPEHRLFGRFAGVDAALWKLPRVLADPLAPKDLVPGVDDDDGYVRAITVTIQHRGHPESLVDPIVPQNPDPAKRNTGAKPGPLTAGVANASGSTAPPSRRPARTPAARRAGTDSRRGRRAGRHRLPPGRGRRTVRAALENIFICSKMLYKSIYLIND